MRGSMKQLSQPANRYLWFRDETSIIWFRMAVPKAHRQRAGASIIQQSLGTTDLHEARIAAGKLRASLFDQWRGGLVPTLRDIEELAAEIGYEAELASMDQGRRNMKGKGPNMFVFNVRWHRALLADRIRAVATGDVEPVEAIAADWIERLGWNLTRDSDGYVRLCELLNLALHEASKTHLARLSGDIEADTDSKLIKRVREHEHNDTTTGDTIRESFALYSARRLREGKRLDSVEQDRILVDQFAGFIGTGRNLRSVTREDVRDFRNTLERLPRAYRNRNAYKHLDMRAAAGKAAQAGEKGLSVATINKNLSQLSPFFAWAVKDGYADINPVDGLFLNSDREPNHRPPFTVAQLNAMFTSPLFAGFERDGREHRPGECRTRDWRFWIPLLCLCTGSRIGEVAQLRLADCRKENGRRFFYLREDEETDQRTKSRKTRVVPMHPVLAAIGFETFYQRESEAADDEDRQLFPTLSPNSRGLIGATPSKFWRAYLRKIGIKDGADGLGAHSFRHTMADEFRLAGFMDHQFGPLILGHNKGTVTGKYGRLPQGTADMLCAMIDAVAFKGVKFDHLMDRGISAGS